MGVPSEKYEYVLNNAIANVMRAIDYSRAQSVIGFPVNKESDILILKNMLVELNRLRYE